MNVLGKLVYAGIIKGYKYHGGNFGRDIWVIFLDYFLLSFNKLPVPENHSVTVLAQTSCINTENKLYQLWEHNRGRIPFYFSTLEHF